MTLVEGAEVERAVDRLASEILASSGGPGLCFVGIERGGPTIARRLAARIERQASVAPPVGTLDITLYRDDLGSHPVPQVGPTHISFPITGRTVVLVDDVLYTGRTVRAALDELVDFGRPRRVYLAVLVERPGRELPIQPDFVGLRLDAREDERLEVLLAERDGRDAVIQKPRGG